MREKCPNFKVCGRFHEHPNTLVCTNCYFKYNNMKLHFVNDVECPVCLEIVQCVRFLRCRHYACVSSCFRRLEICPICRSDPKYFEILKSIL